MLLSSAEQSPRSNLPSNVQLAFSIWRAKGKRVKTAPAYLNGKTGDHELVCASILVSITLIRGSNLDFHLGADLSSLRQHKCYLAKRFKKLQLDSVEYIYTLDKRGA